MLIITHPEHKEAYIAYFESIFGIGIGFGPVVGALLFNLCGFFFTFACLGFCFIVLVSLFILVMPDDINKDNAESTNLTQDHNRSDGEMPTIKI